MKFLLRSPDKNQWSHPNLQGAQLSKMVYFPSILLLYSMHCNPIVQVPGCVTCLFLQLSLQVTRFLMCL
jgi:hypothetical protein